MRKGVVGSVSAYSWPPSTSLLWDSAGGQVVVSWFPSLSRIHQGWWSEIGQGGCGKIWGGPT